MSTSVSINVLTVSTLKITMVADDKFRGSDVLETAEKEAGRPLPPRRPPPGARRGGGADHPDARGGDADAADRRRTAGGVANRSLSALRRQAGAAGSGWARGVPDATPDLDRGVGAEWPRARRIRGHGHRLRAVRRRSSVTLPRNVRRLHRVVRKGCGVHRGSDGGVSGARRFAARAAARRPGA